MKIQVIKESVSKFLEKDYDVLDLFYKMPGDYEFTKKEWDDFHLVPDYLLKYQNELFLAFVIVEIEEKEKILEYIKKYSSFLPFKVFFVKVDEIFEIDTETFSKKYLDKIKIIIDSPTKTGISFSPKKSQDGTWLKNREFGKRGEEEVIKYLNLMKIQAIDLNFNSPDDERSGIQDWRKFNKMPDGIAKKDDEVYFFDAKAKRSEKWVVNERDYKKYQAKMEFLPVKIYFVYLTYDGKKIRKLFVHNVNMNEHEILFMGHDKNKVVDLSHEVEEIG